MSNYWGPHLCAVVASLKYIGYEFCTEALEEYGAPEIFNTDQGSQFTSDDFTGILKKHGVKISMDGRGRWVDNVFVERLWRSVKLEEVYLRAFDDIRSANASLSNYFEF